MHALTLISAIHIGKFNNYYINKDHQNSNYILPNWKNQTSIHVVSSVWCQRHYTQEGGIQTQT